MTALIGSAMFGLVPLPSMATSDTWDAAMTIGRVRRRIPHIGLPSAGHHRKWPPVKSLRAYTTSRDINADLTRTAFRQAGTKKAVRSIHLSPAGAPCNAACDLHVTSLWRRHS